MKDKNPKKIKNGGEGTKIGKWLRSIDREDILQAGSVATNIITGNWMGAVGAIKELIDDDKMITPEQKAEGNKVISLEYKDIAGARGMYKETDHKTADIIAKKVIRWNILIAFAATILLIVCVIYIDDKVLIAIISASLSALSTALMQERQQVINFFFGSSIGSKDKTVLLGKK